MARAPKYYKHDTCECHEQNGCEECTCSDCGDWLESSDDSICYSCIIKYELENNCE